MIRRGGSDVETPTIGADGTIYITTSDSLYAISQNGSKKWGFPLGDLTESTPAIGIDGTLYITSESKLYAIYPNGTKKWSCDIGYCPTLSPAIGSDGIIYVCSRDDKKIYSIYPNGNLKWEFQADDWIATSPSIGPDGTVYIGFNDGKLNAIGYGKRFASVHVSSNPDYLRENQTSIITVQVENETNKPIPNATIILKSDNGGMLNPMTGKTDSNGYFNSSFTAPFPMDGCKITALMNKTSYPNCSGYVYVYRNPISENIIIILPICTLMALFIIFKTKKSGIKTYRW